MTTNPKHPPISDPLVDEKYATRFLDLADGTLAVLRSRRSSTCPPFFKVGRSVKYRLSDLEKYLAARRVEPLTA